MAPPGWPSGWRKISLPEERNPDSLHQNRPDSRQQLRKSLDEPHGQRSFRPSFSSSSLSPWTIRTPRFTRDSDGNPLRRLLIVSKKWQFIELLGGHGTPSFLKMARDTRHGGSREVRLSLGQGTDQGTRCNRWWPSPGTGLTWIGDFSCGERYSEGSTFRSILIARQAGTPDLHERDWRCALVSSAV